MSDYEGQPLRKWRITLNGADAYMVEAHEVRFSAGLPQFYRDIDGTLVLVLALCTALHPMAVIEVGGTHFVDDSGVVHVLPEN
jgi:hypothetical protein